MTNPTPEALAECPFCGAPPVDPTHDEEFGVFVAGCSQCPAIVHGDGPAEAIAAWNARPEPRQPDKMQAVRRVEELRMTPFSEAAPVRDEFMGEQTILTYSEAVGVWGLEFFESGWEFPDRWIGGSHWIDITSMWPGVTAQVTEFSNASHPTSEPLPGAVERVAKALCQAALGDKLCPCGEYGKFNCEEEHPGRMARAAIAAMPASSGEVGQVVAWLRRYAIEGEEVRGKTPSAAWINALNDAADAIERGEHRGTPADHGWRDIASAPKDGTDILAVVAGNHPQSGQPFLPETVAWDGRNEAWWNCMWGWDNAHSEYQPTHWQPLPAPPHRGTDGSAEG